MRKIWLIVKREYITRVRTRAFVIGTIGIPLFTFGIFGFSVFVASRQVDHTLRIALLDETGGLATSIARGLTEKLPNGQPVFHVVKTLEAPAASAHARDELRDQVLKGQLDGYLVVPRGAAEGEAAEFHTKNPGDITQIGSVRRALSDAVIARRLKDRGVRLDDVSRIVRGLDLKTIKVTKEGEAEEKGQTFLSAIIVATLLYTTLIIYGAITMRSVLEEKTTRIVEILVSSVRPFQLLAGKILGVAAVAMTQYLIWTSAAGLIGAYGATMASAVRPGATMPRLHLSPAVLGYSVVFFLAGYFLYASLYAAAGAVASNEQEAQQVVMPITLLIVVSFLMFNAIMRNPNSRLSVVLSLVPFMSPILMVFRIALTTPPFWQIALALALCVLTTLGIIQFSAKIYRVGILMYGKRPSMVELLRWLRYT